MGNVVDVWQRAGNEDVALPRDGEHRRRPALVLGAHWEDVVCGLGGSIRIVEVRTEPGRGSRDAQQKG